MTLDLVAILGIVGSVASVIGLLLPSSGWRSKVIHVVYGLAITLLAVSLTYYQAKVSELTKIENQAHSLATSQDTSYRNGSEIRPTISDRGFMLAALTFFEKYRERFPETYARAKIFCENAGVLQSANEGSYSDKTSREGNLSEGAKAMRALLEGVASGGLN